MGWQDPASCRIKPRLDACRIRCLMGFLKNHLSSDDEQELLVLIEEQRQGLVPLIVPLT
jgi:uncharacterized protein YbgA (DUF1722 family)